MASKKIYNLVVVLFATGFVSVFGQATTTQNYVMTNTVKQAGIATEAQVNSLPIATQGKSQAITYFDGLSRPMQNIITNGSATQHDMITGVEYDSLGREVIKYLQYSDIGNTATPGGYRTAWKAAQNTFYSSGAMTNVDTSTAPYITSVLEPSPLNRVFAQGAPGTNWQPNLSNPFDPTSHSMQTKYLINKVGDSIRYFTINAAGIISSSTYYDSNKIDIGATVDEQQQTVKEYKDLLGHTILKRVFIAGDSLQTYFIYDSMNLLRAVIQPEGTVILKANNWIFPELFSSNWMFLYRYDERNRMVMKKMPGADSVNMLYDQWDRVVLTQDGNLRTSHFWLFTKYDQLNRPILTGQITDTRALSAVQTDVSNSTGRFESVSTSATEGYTLNGTFPSSSSYTLAVYTTTHYDSYSNLPSWSSAYNYVNEYGVSPQNTNLIGQVIATQVKVIGTVNFNRTVSYYDDKYRVVQFTGDNPAGGKDRITKLFTFDGKIVYDYHSHTSRFFTSPLLIQQTYTYDHMDRPLILTHQTGTQEIVTLLQNSYNEVGQLLNKKIHQSPSHLNSLQKIDYFYNIRGWISGINRPVTSENGYEENDLFNIELHYNNPSMPGSLAQFNGNIGEEIYKYGYDENESGYNYQYDQSNRLKKTSWGLYSSTGWNQSLSYDETGISYDHNSNILTLSRYCGGWNKVDSLGYKNYIGNQLGKVDDLVTGNVTPGFQDKDNGSGYDYSYDLNGNLKSDYNKNIGLITYNYLNLPNVVTVTGKGTITYTYDAFGNKLQKTILDQTLTPNKTTNYYYAGNYVYRNDTLEFISTAEGRLRPVKKDTAQAISIANLKYIYDYYLQDHLGNTRSVLTTEQQNDIYAATMETANAGKEDALFNNISSTSAPKLAGFSNDAQNQRASKLNGTIGNKRVGPSIVLKVMAGDTISVSAYSWYVGTTQPPASNPNSLVSELIPLLAGGISGQNGGKGGAVLSTYSDPFMDPDIRSVLKKDSLNYDNTRPRAFLNWMVVGEDYIAATNSMNHVGATQIPVCNTGDTLKQLFGPTNMVVRRNGWIYIYVSNESAQDVYFDNLVINLKHGPLLEQKDYFAFGMENPVLSTKALKFNYIENRRKYNQGSELQSKEFADGSGLELYDFNARMYDPQLGRFLKIDPLADFTPNNTPYAYVGNNPLLFSDPMGLDTVRVNGAGAHSIKIGKGDILAFTIDKVTSYYKYDPDNKDAVGGFVGEGIQEGRLAPVTFTSQRNSNNKDQNGYIRTAIAAGLSFGDYKMFNNKTWYSLPKWRTFNQSFMGNGATGGKIALAKKVSTGFKWAGYVMVVANTYCIATDREMSTEQKLIEFDVSLIAVRAGPVYGTAIAGGWELGRFISKREWYRENIRPVIQDAIGVPRDERYLNINFEASKQ